MTQGKADAVDTTGKHLFFLGPHSRFNSWGSSAALIPSLLLLLGELFCCCLKKKNKTKHKKPKLYQNDFLYLLELGPAVSALITQ